MLQFMLIGFGIFILWGVVSLYSCHEEEKDKAKEEVSKAYKKLFTDFII